MKRFLIFFAAAVLLAVFTAFPSPPSRAESLWFTVINDYILDFTPANRPVKDITEMRLPHLALSDKDSDLGVEWQWFPGKRELTISSGSRSISFVVGSYTAYDQDGTRYEQQCLPVRQGNSTLYMLPVSFLCEFFNWNYKEISTDYGMMLRIKSKLAIKDDIFVLARGTALREKYEAYLSSLEATASSSPVVSLPPKPSASPGVTSPNPADMPVTVHLLFEGGLTEYTPQILDLLDERGIKAAFFVREEDSVFTDELRRIAATHEIGLQVSPENEEVFLNSTEEMLLLLSSANAMLKETTLSCSRLVLMPGTQLSGDFRNELVLAGYRFWEATISADVKSTRQKLTSKIDSAITSSRKNDSSVVISLKHNQEALSLLPVLINRLNGAECRYAAINALMRPVNSFNDPCLPS